MLRIANAADFPRISEIRDAVRENPLTTNREAVAVTADWIMAHRGFWVWEEGGRIHGFSAADVRDGTIFALFVDPASEGRGVGRALIEAALEGLRPRWNAATLTTDPGTRAERFYRRGGWTEIGRQDDGQIVFRKAL